MNDIVIGWFSCGITSAIACKIALIKYKNVELYYTDPGKQDEDSIRFLHDCEKWYGRKINILKSSEYENHFDVIEKQKMIKVNVHFYPCTHCLKRS